jgi:hypothetical protein
VRQNEQHRPRDAYRALKWAGTAHVAAESSQDNYLMPVQDCTNLGSTLIKTTIHFYPRAKRMRT